ncbi:MAG: FtsW/RodA/SpoVE family cell cycle protein, partial [Ignavibacteriae bacterium]|nr:FtsW/RodA/SpoVE family cell cycle protein [Ignavibacteriota bacterium]
GVPTLLILKQPNLGTASILLMISGSIFFAAGVRVWKFMVVIFSVIAMLPVVWILMHDYQKQRVLTFLNPESDPLGAGYNIIQSIIAIGSGGIWGKGFVSGTQSQLDFLPEKQTDFVFTILAEEFGFIGVMTMFLLSICICVIGYFRTLSVDSQFARLIITGVTSMFALHVI